MKDFYTTKDLVEKHNLTAPFLREVINMGHIETEKLGACHLIDKSNFKKGVKSLIKNLNEILEAEEYGI